MNTFENISLDDVRLFVAVAKHLSFIRAAEDLGVPSPSVSRRIKNLEQTLGVKLLHRSTRQVRLTSAGAQYFEQCAPIIEAWNSSTANLLNLKEEVSGTIKLSMPVDFGIQYMSDILAAFIQRYPKVNLVLNLSSSRLDLADDGFDIAIRLVDVGNDRLFSKRLGALSMGIYASTEFMQTHPLSHPEQLNELPTLAIGNNQQLWSLKNTQTGESCRIELRPKVVANNLSMLVQLCQKGVGVALLSKHLIERNPESTQNLQLIFPDWRVPSVNVYLVSLTSVQPLRVKLLQAFIQEHLHTLLNL